MASTSAMGRSRAEDVEEDEALIGVPVAHRLSCSGKKIGIAIGSIVLACSAVVAVMPVSSSKGMPSLQDVGQKDQRIFITPSFWSCSPAKENCMDSGCCQVSGHTCFMKTGKVAYCNDTCSSASGWLCGIPQNGHPSVPVQKNLNKSLYCFSVFTHNTGTTKRSYELDLLKTQHKHSVSIFSCDGWDVFSDVRAFIGGKYYSHEVEDKFGEFHQVKRNDTGSWVNWGIFYQVWFHVRHLGHWEDKSWTVKVDPDAVFLPVRLMGWLDNKAGESPHGIYFENCPKVQYGFFGNLEVMSNKATVVLTKYLEDCHAVFAPCANQGCDWKWGPWGEDVFVQRCLDRHYVDKVEAFDLTTDGACEADRPEGQKKSKKWHAEDCSQVATASVHPFKTPKDYFRCLGQITHLDYA